MITSCDSCCFLNNPGDGVFCGANKLFTIGENGVFASGFCKNKRSTKWAKDQKKCSTNLLLEKICLENRLIFDLIIIFDRNKQSIESLNKTLSTDWTNKMCKQIIVADITGLPNLNYNLFNIVDNNTGIPMSIDCACDKENEVRTIRRLVSRCRQKYFMVISAGSRLSNIHNLYKHMFENNDRNVYYRFPTQFNDTKIDSIDNDFYGLYITHIFKSLTTKCTEQCSMNQPCSCKTFQQDICKSEDQCGIKLSTTFWNSVFI